MLTQVEVKATQILEEKKKKAVEAYVKKNYSGNASRISNYTRRKTTDIERLLNLWKQGGLSNSKAKEILSERLGIRVITPDIEAEMNRYLDEIDKAQQGFEREKLEEEFAAYQHSLRLDGGIDMAFFDRMRLRLFGPFTKIVNLTGITTSASKAAAMVFRNNLPLIRGKGGDKYIGKVAKLAAAEAVKVASDILVNGGVDMGLAFSETTGTKAGSPKIRYSEYNFKKKWYNKPLPIKGTNINVYDAALKREKYISRFMSASDVLSQMVLQELEVYDQLKHTIRTANPTISNSEASRMAFENMYSFEIEEAKAQAFEEYKKRGIDLDFEKRADKVRFNRRVFEIVQQSRDAKITKMAEFHAGRYTFKKHDIGLMTPFVIFANAVKKMMYGAANKIEANSREINTEKGLDNIESDLARRTANGIRALTELIFVKFAPFINGIANVTEKGFELTPYGMIKAGVQAAYVTYSGEEGTYTYRRAFDLAFRSTQGTILLMVLAAFLADDEDKDGIPDIFGVGPEDAGMREVASKSYPANTISIQGHKIPLAYLGVIGVPLKVMGDYYDRKRLDNEDKLDTPLEYLAYTGNVALSTANELYTESLMKAIRQVRGEDPSGFFAASSAELITRASIPFISYFRQGDALAFPEATVAIGFGENIAKYTGLLGSFADNRLAFDYRGKEYDLGTKYTNSPDGLVKAFSEQVKTDSIDTFMLKYHPKVVFQRQSEFAVPMDVLMASSIPISDGQFYDFKKNQAKKFGDLLELYYATDPENRVYELGKVSDETKLKAYKNQAKELLTEQGIAVNLQDPNYISLLDKETQKAMMDKKKKSIINNNITMLFNLSQEAAYVEMIESLNGVVPVDLLEKKEEYEKVKKYFSQ